jgi:hypothetical protein
MMLVYAVVDEALSPDFPLGDTLEVFIRREDPERFIEGACARRTRSELMDAVDLEQLLSDQLNSSSER